MSASYPHPIIAREGWPFLAAAVARRGGRDAGSPAGGRRRCGSRRCSCCSSFAIRRGRFRATRAPWSRPPMGAIVAVERARDPYLERDAIKISVFMNVFNVHSNRSPVDGRVQKRWYNPGTFRQRRARQGLRGERAQRPVAANGRRRRRHLRAGRRPDREAHSVLRRRGRRSREGTEVRLHPLRLARRHLPFPRTRSPVAALGDKVYASSTVIATLADHGLSPASASRC